MVTPGYQVIKVTGCNFDRTNKVPLGEPSATAVIYAEAKLGELLKAIPKPKFDKPVNGSLRGTTETLPPGVSKRTSHQAQTIAAMVAARLANFKHGGDRKSDQAANLPLVSQPEAARRRATINAEARSAFG